MKKLFTKNNLLYALFMLVIGLLVLEFGGRWYLSNVLQKSSDRKFQFDSWRVYAHVPGFQESDEKGPRLSINAQGFRRATDVQEQKPDGTFRIFLMGGSAAHGISSAKPFPIGHVRDDETIDAHLERMLTAHYPGRRFEVINAAVTGYRVNQHTAYLLAELLHFDPDMVIFFDGANDHFKYNPGEDQYRDNGYQFWKSRLQQPSLTGLFDHFTLWASDFSGFARGLYAWRNNKDAQAIEQDLLAHVSGWSDAQIVQGYLSTRGDQYLRSVSVNLSILKDRGIHSLVCFQPFLRFRDTADMSTDERDVLLPLLGDQHRNLLRPLILQDLDSVTTRYSAGFIDANTTLGDPSLKGKPLFLDYCHLTALGSELAARTLLPEVITILSAADSAANATPTPP